MKKICRYCGSETYKKVVEGNDVDGPGYQERILYYECDGCSALFKDPDKFFIRKIELKEDRRDSLMKELEAMDAEEDKPVRTSNPFNSKLLYGVGTPDEEKENEEPRIFYGRSLYSVGIPDKKKKGKLY